MDFPLLHALQIPVPDVAFGLADPGVSGASRKRSTGFAAACDRGTRRRYQDFERLVFDWPRSVAYNVHRNAARVTIYFAVQARVSFRNSTRAFDAHARFFFFHRSEWPSCCFFHDQFQRDR